LERDAWRTWLAEHGPALLLFARQWLSRRLEAEDVVQEAFVRFWKSRERADDPVAYLYQCVRNTALEFRRGDARRQAREMDSARPEWFEASFADDDRTVEIECALRNLPDAQREVLVLKIWGGLTFAQIGSALEISPDTAASRYRYAIEKMRQQLASKQERVP
jgi:RNA polymerase sigma-70 factor (ECF subfamily)